MASQKKNNACIADETVPQAVKEKGGSTHLGWWWRTGAALKCKTAPIEDPLLQGQCGPQAGVKQGERQRAEQRS